LIWGFDNRIIRKKERGMANEIVESPMPGTVISISVKVGDEVKEDDDLLVLEAMKMKNPIVAPVSGKIIEIKVKPDQAVDSGDALIVIGH